MGKNKFWLHFVHSKIRDELKMGQNLKFACTKCRQKLNLLYIAIFACTKYIQTSEDPFYDHRILPKEGFSFSYCVKIVFLVQAD